MHANIEAVEARLTRSELPNHLGIDGVKNLFREIALGDPSLIGHHHGRDPGAVQPAYGLGRSGQEPDARRMIDVPCLFGEATVAVHEHGGASGHWKAV
jgi:hypothetical protein